MSYLARLKAEFSGKRPPSKPPKPSKAPFVSFGSTPSSRIPEIEAAPAGAELFDFAPPSDPDSDQAAATIQRLQGQDHEVNALARELSAQIEAANNGDLRRAEAMPVAQAHTLDELFNNLARRATRNIGEHMNAAETYFRLALKAQSQCRATLETLAAIKNPPVVFARQANVTTGPQQVNNGLTIPSRARETEIGQNTLLEAQDGERLDSSAPGKATAIDPAMAPVGEIDRPKDVKG